MFKAELDEKTLKDEIDAYRSTVESKRAEIKALKDSLEKDEATLKELSMSLYTRQLLDSIHDVYDIGYFPVKIRRETGTIWVFDTYRESGKKFLILDLNIRTAFYYYELVIVKDDARKYYADRSNGPSMSDLKNRRGSVVHRLGSDPKLETLTKELLKIDPSERGEFIPFSIPVYLRAQDSTNRTGYGSIYEGEDCVIEGTLYGETHGYLIIGVHTASKYF